MTPLDALAQRWPALNALLDEALALPIAERSRWLESLAGEQAGLKDTLRELLATHAGVETGDFLGTLPKLAPSDEARATDDEPMSGDSVGPYRLISELGHGGMGAVWLAERADGQLKRQVALKLPRMAWGRGLAERLARERDILATLAHANIARLYDAGVDQQGRPYLAMEHVEGQPIDVHCRERALTLRARIELLLQVCDAVAHAHSRLVVHRDLKPSNILVTADGQVRLLDFGIAKLMEGDSAQETALTRLSGRALTLDYASPEQIRGEPLGTASDVYSLAVVAFELLAGARPYRLKRGSAAELEEAIASAEPPLVSDATTDPALKKQLRGDLDAILNKALKKQPEERYATVVAFADDLRRHLDEQPVLAQPDRLAYRMGKFTRRHRLQVAAAGFATLALLAGTGLALWQAQRALDQAARAEEVKRFVLSMFADADTGKGGNRSTTAVQLLQRAHERLSTMKDSDPAVSSELLKAVGDSLIGLGEYAQAEKVLEDALRLARTELGEDSAATAEAELALGELLFEQGRSAEAQQHLDAAERGMRRLADRRGLVNTLRWKAYLIAGEGRVDESVAAATEAARLAEQLPASDKRTRMLSQVTLSNVLSTTNPTGGLQAARRAYDLAREIHGDKPSVDVVTMRSQWADALARGGAAGQGLVELQALLPDQIMLQGPAHLDVARTHHRIGNAALAIGEPAIAIDSLRRGREILITQGIQQAYAGVFSYLLGAALMNARRLDEAEVELDRAVKMLPDKHPNQRVTVSTLALVRMRRGRLEDADFLLERLAAQSVPDRPRDAAIMKLRLGLVRSAKGQHDEAVSLVQASETHFAADPRRVEHARALAALGEVLLAAGQFEQALPVLGRSDELFSASQPEMSHDRADVLVLTARASLALGRTDAAVAAASPAAKRWQALDADNRSAGLAWLWLARALALQGPQSEADSALREAARVLEAVGFPSDKLLLRQTQQAAMPSVTR